MPKGKTGCDDPAGGRQLALDCAGALDWAMDTSPNLSDPTDAYLLDDQVGYLLRLASQRHALIFQEFISEDLTPTQFSTLIRVAEQGEVSQNHLGRLAAMDIATIKGVVDRLKQKGFLVTNPDANDKRRSIISLTRQGAQMMEKLRRDGHSISEATLGPLKPSEQKRLLELLRKIS